MSHTSRKHIRNLIGMLLTIGASVQAAFLDFVSIGSPGNAADTNGIGSVSYAYAISTYEVKGSKMFTAITDDPRIGNYTGTANVPATGVSWYEAAKFCNWMTSGDAYDGAYKFDVNGVFQGVDRTAAIATHGTIYALPTQDEWYKAAYYTGSGFSLFANGSDIAPLPGIDARYSTNSFWLVGSGSVEQNGTYDMAGNAWEWMETWSGDLAIRRGGAYNSGDGHLKSINSFMNDPTTENNTYGFRVVQVIPEPGVLSLVIISSITVFGIRRLIP